MDPDARFGSKMAVLALTTHPCELENCNHKHLASPFIPTMIVQYILGVSVHATKVF